MKAKYLTLIGTALVATTSSVAVAQSSNTSTQFKMSPEGTAFLCKEFPLNSRCAGSATKPSTSSSSTPSSTSAPNTNPPSTTTGQDTNPSSTSAPNTNPPSTTTGIAPSRPTRTTVPGSTTPTVGTPPGAGSQKKPYVSPQ